MSIAENTKSVSFCKLRKNQTK